MHTYEDINDAFINSLKTLSTDGIEYSPKKIKTKEILLYRICIKNPIRRILTIPHRYSNIFATIAEMLWVFSGRDDLNFLSYFLPNAKNYSDNGKVWRGAYGPRLMDYNNTKFDQISNIIKTLKKDPFSRQAIILIPLANQDYDVNLNTKDRPCTIFVQFFIRNNELCCSANLRSNDVIFGFSSINIPEWTFIQEIIAGILKVKIGKYYHTANSFHIYENHFARMHKILMSNKYNVYQFEKVEKQPIKFSSLNAFYISTKYFMACIEKSINDKNFIYNEEDVYNYLELDAMPYLDYLNLVLVFVTIKQSNYHKAYSLIDDISRIDMKVAALEYFIRFVKKQCPSCAIEFINKIEKENSFSQPTIDFITGNWS